jgi:hypothetical protein
MPPQKLTSRSCLGVHRSCLGVHRSCLGVHRSCLGVGCSGKLLSHKRLYHRSGASYPNYPIYPKGRWVVAGGCADAAPPLQNNHPAPSRPRLSPTRQGWGPPVSVPPRATLDVSVQPRRRFPVPPLFRHRFFTVSSLFLRCFPAVSRLFWRWQVSLIFHSTRAGARHSGRHCGVIRVRGGAVDLYRRRAGRRGALYQFRPGARGNTPPAPVFSTRETRWGTA